MDRINMEFNSQHHIQTLRQQGLQSQARKAGRLAGQKDAGQGTAVNNRMEAEKEQSSFGRVFASLRAVFAK